MWAERVSVRSCPLASQESDGHQPTLPVFGVKSANRNPAVTDVSPRQTARLALGSESSEQAKSELRRKRPDAEQSFFSVFNHEVTREKPNEALYDLSADPGKVKNLAAETRLH
jgi:hypothetical protein